MAEKNTKAVKKEVYVNQYVVACWT